MDVYLKNFLLTPTSKVRLPEISVPPDQPFRDDKLGRDKFAYFLTDIVEQLFEGEVIALNGAWGTGKTAFVRMWKQHLENKGFSTIYYDAWKNDYNEEPLLSMLKELKSLSNNDGGDKLDKLLRIGAKIVTSIISGVLTGALDAVSDNELSNSIWGRINIKKRGVKIITGGAKEGVKKIESLILDSLKKEDSIQGQMYEFKKAFEAYVPTVCENGKPLVFFVDELDRCNPSFAVKVLERIKHLFESANNVIFVLSIDKKQLAYSINGYYGSEQIDSMEYLRRFIDIDFNLPEPDPLDYCNYLFEQYGFSALNTGDYRNQINEEEKEKFDYLIHQIDWSEKGGYGDYYSVMKYLASYKHVTLRQLERIFLTIRFVFCYNTLNLYETKTVTPHIGVLLFLAYLKVCENEIYTRIRTLQYSVQELLSIIENFIPANYVDYSNNEDFLTYCSSLFRILANYCADIRIRSYFLRHSEYENYFETNKISLFYKDGDKIIESDLMGLNYSKMKIDELINHGNIEDYYDIGLQTWMKKLDLTDIE